MERDRPDCKTDYDERDAGGGVNVTIEEIVRENPRKKPFQLPTANQIVVLENVGVTLGKVEKPLQSTTVSEQRGLRLSGVLTSPLRALSRRVMYELTRDEVTKGAPLCGVCGAAVSTAWNALGGRSGYKDTPQGARVGHTNRGR
ncbi:hypothetical protein PI125_g19616 [Phytophthora idaei]|nr:hypothetical protein PI125_g19616 [Phytophthora idaei]